MYACAYISDAKAVIIAKYNKNNLDCLRHIERERERDERNVLYTEHFVVDVDR
jgi:hypothetical protein